MKNNKYRAFIFEDQMEIRQMLERLLDKRGYETLTFSHPPTCPFPDEAHCTCPEGHVCADILLTDVDMPHKNGLDFIEEQINRGCKCKHIAVMSGAFTEDDLTRAKSLGIMIFEKPFQLKNMMKWLDQAEAKIPRERKLSDHFLEEVQNGNNCF